MYVKPPTSTHVFLAMVYKYIRCLRFISLLLPFLLLACSQRGYTPSFEELHTGKMPVTEKLASERSLFLSRKTKGKSNSENSSQKELKLA